MRQAMKRKAKRKWVKLKPRRITHAVWQMCQPAADAYKRALRRIECEQ